MEHITARKLIHAFFEGETSMRTGTRAKPGPLRIMNNKLISFETVICERYGDDYIVNPTFYSKQTEYAQKILMSEIPIEKQIWATGVPFTYWGSLVSYINTNIKVSH